MFSSPNMLDIHNANLSLWSPLPYFIGGFFFPQQLFQLAWLYRLYKLDPKKPVERTELDQIGKYPSRIISDAGHDVDKMLKLTSCLTTPSATCV